MTIPANERAQLLAMAREAVTAQVSGRAQPRPEGLDGTLAETLTDIALTMNEVLVAAGLPGHSVDAYRGFVGDGVRMLAGRALPEAERERADEMVAAFRRLYPGRMYDHTELYPGVPEMLDALVDGGAKLAILSNKPHHFTVEMVERLLGRWSFEPVWGQQEGRPVKPDPAAALAIAEGAGTRPERSYFVGDMPVDIMTGLNAGMHPVAVPWGFRGGEELLAAGAEFLLEDAAELPKLVLED